MLLFNKNNNIKKYKYYNLKSYHKTAATQPAGKE